MPFYWTDGGVPEFQELVKTGRGKDWWRCKRKCIGDWQVWAGLVATFALFAIGWLVALVMFDSTLIGIILGGLGSGAGAVFTSQIVVDLTRRRARSLLEDEP